MEIIVIEDEPIIRRALVKLIKSVKIDGFNIKQITEVEYAEDAVEYFNNNTYDIIFTDIECGEMSGLDLIKDFREIQSQAEWVIISGYDNFEFAQRAILYDVREYLLKPVTNEKITETIERCIRSLSEIQNDYIEANEIDLIIQELNESIWQLEPKKVEQIFDQWKSNMQNKSFSINYYCDTLTYILEVLFRKVEKRGSRLLQAFQWKIETPTMELTNEQFLKKCYQIIQMLETQRKGSGVDPIEVAKEYINEHIGDDISLEDVADKLGLNASYFSQLFKKETGENFIQYRIRLRMEKAKDLLLQGDIKVIDIPFLIGLNDHPHFTKTFKKYTGYTPSNFRKKMGVD